MDKLKLYISTGKYRKTILNVPDNSEPVKDVVKQSAFSYIGKEFVENKYIADLYCGSGQLGFESLSLGAKTATFVDEDYNAKVSVNKTVEKLNLQEVCEFIHKDALKFIGENDKGFDLVLADPPYSYKHKHLLKTVNYIVNNGGVFVFFHKSDISEEDLQAEKLKKIETRKFGKSAYSVYTPQN